MWKCCFFLFLYCEEVQSADPLWYLCLICAEACHANVNTAKGANDILGVTRKQFWPHGCPGRGLQALEGFADHTLRPTALRPLEMLHELSGVARASQSGSSDYLDSPVSSAVPQASCQPRQPPLSIYWHFEKCILGTSLGGLVFDLRCFLEGLCHPAPQTSCVASSALELLEPRSLAVPRSCQGCSLSRVRDLPQHPTHDGRLSCTMPGGCLERKNTGSSLTRHIFQLIDSFFVSMTSLDWRLYFTYQISLLRALLEP